MSWLTIWGFPDYEVSDQGQIRNRSGELIQPRKTARGYLQIGLWQHGAKKRVKKQRLVHRLVIITFVGHNWRRKQVAHRNGNRLDNRLENLMWVTPKENADHKRSHGTLQMGEQIRTAKLTPSSVRQIRNLYDGSYSQGELAAMFNVSQMTISKVVRRVSWKHVD